MTNVITSAICTSEFAVLNTAVEAWQNDNSEELMVNVGGFRVKGVSRQLEQTIERFLNATANQGKKVAPDAKETLIAIDDYARAYVEYKEASDGLDDAKPLIPMFSRDENGDGKFSPFCTGTWKRDRMASFLSQSDWPKCKRWIGIAWDEQRRIKRLRESERKDGYTYRFPLDELMIDTHDCVRLVEKFGLPKPKVSRCWFCPHQKNAEWREIRDEHPDLWDAACQEDDEQREQDLFRGGLGVWLHHSRTPLRIADIETDEPVDTVRQCSLGACFV